MKTVKNYEKFSEGYRLNENLFKKAWGSIVNFFRNKYNQAAWVYYVLFLNNAGKLPKRKVEIILPSSAGGNVPTEKDIELSIESSKNEKYGMMMINEEVVDLRHNDPSIRNVDVDELVKKIVRIYDMNADRVEQGKPRTKNHAIFIWGAPGIGKTEVLHSVAEKLGIMVQEWHLSQIEPTDFRGLPKIENVLGSDNPDDERTVTKLPAIFPTSDGPFPELGLKGKGGIMFFDEINRAPKMVLSAALSLCLSGKIGSYELPQHWIVIAAGNRPEDLGGAVATSIEPALANRFAHVNYAPTFESWKEWALSKKHMNPDIIAFLTWDKTYFHKLDPDNEPLTFPSPRSWELASEEEYFARRKDWKNKIPLTEIQEIYTDQIGAEAAVKFKEYLQLKEYYNEKDVAEVYTKGAKAKPFPKRLDQARAAAASVAFHKKGEELSLEELKNVLDFAVKLSTKEEQSTLLSFLKMVHPYAREKEPWKKLYWDAVKKWHVEEDTTGMSISKK